MFDDHGIVRLVAQRSIFDVSPSSRQISWHTVAVRKDGRAHRPEC